MGLISDNSLTETTSVISILEEKGVDYSKKKPNYSIKGVSAEVGKQIFHNGFSNKPNGGTSKKQSKHFVCSTCHNTVVEDPNLTVSDPETRLDYAIINDIPFLQGTTMYGAVNRKTYYNGDYYKKYGTLVNDARNNIRNSIQLCATECAQGRALKDWELESILAYLWTLEYKIDDIGINNTDIQSLSIEQIESKYIHGSPATFIPPPADRKSGSEHIGNPKNGKSIYTKSCLHCHLEGKYAFFDLDTCRMSFKHLNKNISKYSRHSMYQVIRWGVPPKNGKRSYMPQYTKERMSDQQLADLRAYIEKEAS
ncbi:MAG: cytochrome c [Saprospiraceae bacterium]